MSTECYLKLNAYLSVNLNINHTKIQPNTSIVVHGDAGCTLNSIEEATATATTISFGDTSFNGLCMWTSHGCDWQCSSFVYLFLVFCLFSTLSHSGWLCALAKRVFSDFLSLFVLVLLVLVSFSISLHRTQLLNNLHGFVSVACCSHSWYCFSGGQRVTD